jgi:hypothetical protein
LTLSDAHRSAHPLGTAQESACGHAHAHPHTHGEGTPHPARVPASLLRLSATARLACAGVLVALLWAVTFWVVS